MTDMIWYAVPFFFLTMGLEWGLTAHRERKGGYTLKDSLASLAMGLGNRAVDVLPKAAVFAVYLWIWEHHRIFEIPQDAWWAWVILIPIEDLCYYWFHRASHEVRLLWAAHVNHHSSTHYNLSTALRQSWTTPFTGPLFWLPLPLLGFHPFMVAVAQTISLLYQYWIHTEAIRTLGPLEWVFNTPSHHRVHHGSNPEYLDRNHGGILIVWDRLFGTFEPERAEVEYGLTTNIATFNPVLIAFHEWAAMLRDVLSARTWRGRLGYLFLKPGWREDGTGKTSADLRAEARRRRPA
ncbi:MAG: sterol desaturase family protein [Sandaracinaceae bacterium]|nr:sterol desaturase family protein [Sandaracinaceae bacterium]